MKIEITAQFPINRSEDRDAVIASLQEDIGDAGFNTDDILEKSEKSDPIFIITGEVNPIKVTWKQYSRTDNMVIRTESIIDATFLRQFKILEIRLV